MRLLLTTLLLATLLLAGAGRDPLPEHGTAITSVAQGKPSQLKVYDTFLGSWTIAGKVLVGPDQWANISGTSTWETILGGSAVQEMTTVTYPDGRTMTYLALHSYDKFLNRYRSIYMDDATSLADVFEHDGFDDEGLATLSNAGLTLGPTMTEDGPQYRHSILVLERGDVNHFQMHVKTLLDGEALEVINGNFVRVQE